MTVAGGGPPPSGFQILTPAFYDQSGQFIVGNGRGLGTPMRLVSPAPILVNTATGQQGKSFLMCVIFVCPYVCVLVCVCPYVCVCSHVCVCPYVCVFLCVLMFVRVPRS